MRILVTGGTGFIGRHLIQRRLAAGDTVICLSRSPERVQALFNGRVKGIDRLPDADQLQVDAIVNLAGEAIADKRWSAARKQLLRSSRIDLTQQLVEWISQQTVKPEVLISGSAIGYYGSHATALMTEDSTPVTGFTHQLCADWEQAALAAEQSGIRVCLIRTGVVLGKGGALAKMLLPFRMGLGGPIASGQQWMSWIHIDDEVEVIEMLLTHNQLSGAFNLTAPEAATNKAFAKTLGQVLHRPACLPMPGWVIELMLGEGAELLLQGQRVYPQRLLDIGYKFKHSELESALADAVAG